MTGFRTLGLIMLTLGLLVVGVSAPAQVKMPPQIKPGTPPTTPAPAPGTTPKTPTDPKAKNPMPGTGTTTPGTPGTPGSTTPDKKKDDRKWDTIVNGKNVKDTVKDMRTHPDPAVREAAVRALPLFGPKGREEGADDLVDAMTKDPDWNVKLAAITVAPTELLGLLEGPPDTNLKNGLTAIVGYLTHDQLQVRLEALGAVAAVGPYIREVKITVVSTVSGLAHIQSSWQLRRSAAATLASVGQGMSDDPMKRVPPDTGAVSSLLEILKVDNCAAVRREAVNSLIALGPVAASQQKLWRTSLDLVLKNEKDKSVVLWAHALVIRNDPSGLKGNELHLDAIAKVLQATEPGGRLEACQALGLLAEEAVSKIDDLIAIINKDGEPSVVIAAILAITNMPSRDAATVPILQNVKATHVNADVKAVAGEAIEYLAGRKKKN